MGIVHTKVTYGAIAWANKATNYKSTWKEFKVWGCGSSGSLDSWRGVTGPYWPQSPKYR